MDVTFRLQGAIRIKHQPLEPRQLLGGISLQYIDTGRGGKGKTDIADIVLVTNFKFVTNIGTRQRRSKSYKPKFF